MPAKNASGAIEDRLKEHSQRIKLLEEIFKPMAITAMEIISGKPGEAGMAENLRGLREDFQQLIEAQRQERVETQKIRENGFKRIGDLETWRVSVDSAREIKVAGTRMTADTRMALINGVFLLAVTVVTYVLNQ